jgi:hypothetical protein
MKIKKVNEINNSQIEFSTLNKAKLYCKSLGEISDIKFIENNNGYGYLETTQYLLTINDKYFFCGGSFSTSKAKTIWFVKEFEDISHLKLRDHTGYPHYEDVKDNFNK